MALLACPHARQNGAGEAVVAEDVRIEGEPGGFHVLHLDRAGNADPGIVDQHVEPAADLALRSGDRVRNFVVEQHVEPQHANVEIVVAGKLLQFFGFGPRGVPHRRENRRAQAGEMLGGQTAETRRATGDEDSLAGQVGRRRFDGIALRSQGRGGEGAGGGGPGQEGAAVDCRHGFVSFGRGLADHSCIRIARSFMNRTSSPLASHSASAPMPPSISASASISDFA